MSWLFDDFLVRALLGGIGVALVAGPLGTFVVWRRMAYFGDSLAHSALLGVAVGFVLGIDLTLGVIAVCLVFAFLLLLLQRQHQLADDTLLGILAHASLALGLVTISFLATLRVDLMGYLFGDLLAVGVTDLAWIWGGGAVVLTALALLWRPLLAVTVHEELARAEGINAGLARAGFLAMIALTVAIAIKIVGVLLVTSLLIIPAAAARRFARTPEQMAAMASLIGDLSVAGGLGASYLWDLPTGPAVVVTAAVLFALASLAPLLRAGAAGLVLAAFAVPALVLPTGRAEAHPHVWIDAWVEVDFTEDAVEAVTVHWTFDEFYSGIVMEDFDANGNGTLDPDELARLAGESRKTLPESTYFTHLWLDGEKVPVTEVDRLEASVDDGLLSYVFTIPLDGPVDPRRQSLVLSLYDESYYVEVILDDVDPVRFQGQWPGTCRFAVAEDQDNPIYFGLVLPLRIDLVCDARES